MSCGTVAGRFNRRIELQADSSGQDAYGEDVESYSTFATVWAEMMSQRAAEKFTGGQRVGTQSISWRIRYRDDVDNLSRVVYDGKVYMVEGVTEGEGRRQELILTTTAILGR